MRSAIMGGAVFGSILGGFVPGLWGGSEMSLAGLAFSCLGGFAGIWAAVVVTR